MNKNLVKIFWIRYKWFLSSVLLLSFLLPVYQNVATNNHWQDLYRSSKDGRLKKEYIEINKQDKENLKYFPTFEKFTKNRLTIFSSKEKNKLVGQNRKENGYLFSASFLFFNETGAIVLLLSISGFFAFFWDAKSKMNQFWFSSKFKRSDIFTLKYIALCLLPVLCIALGQLIGNFYFFSSIPKEYLPQSVLEVFPMILSNALLAFLLVNIGALFGILMGHVILGLITLSGFLFLNFAFLPLAIENLLYILAKLRTNLAYDNIREIGFERWKLYDFDFLALGSTPIRVLGIYILAILFIFWLMRVSFMRLSLENSEKYLTSPFLRKPVLVFVVLDFFFPMEFSSVQLENWEYPDITTDLPIARSLLEPLNLAILWTAIAFIIFYFLFYGVKGMKKLLPPKIRNKSN